MEKARILLVEDHTIIVEGLRMILADDLDCEIVAEATDGLEAIAAVQELEPDLVILDISMPNMNGIEAAAEIKSISPKTRILILTVHKDEEHVLAAFEAGANGYILKSSNREELRLAVQNVIQGNMYISPSLSGRVMEGFLESAKRLREKTPYGSLTPRERQVLKLIAESNTNQQIADMLYLSVKTVETHRANIMQKLDLHSASELTAYAVKRGLTE